MGRGGRTMCCIVTGVPCSLGAPLRDFGWLDDVLHANNGRKLGRNDDILRERMILVAPATSSNGVALSF